MKNLFIYLLLAFSFFTLSVEASAPSKAIVVTANHYASKAAANIIKKCLIVQENNPNNTSNNNIVLAYELPLNASIANPTQEGLL